MKIFAALLIIIFLTFSGYHLSFRSFRLPLFARKFYLTGTEYIFLGLLLGPFFLNLLDEKTISGLEPLTALLLGWVGLLCGFQFEIREIRRFSKTYLGAALTESVVTFLAVSSTAYLIIPLWFAIPESTLLITAITLGAASSCTSQTGIALFTGTIISKRTEVVRFLQYISSINAIAALILFTPVFLFKSHAILTPTWFKTGGFEILTVVIANISLILLYNLFLSQRRDKKELLLIIIGMVVLTSGAASILQFSPLLANFFMGALLVNTTREKERIFTLLVSIEKPLYLLLLVLIGAYWVPDTYIFLLFALIYCTVRLAGKLSGGFLAAKISYKKYSFPAGLGKGLIEQGGLPLAILFDFNQGFAGSFTTDIISIAIIGLIINDLISPLFLHRFLDREER